MGRGRQKAKHAKVARELKYNSPEMNLSELERELTGKSKSSSDQEWSEYDDIYGDTED